MGILRVAGKGLNTVSGSDCLADVRAVLLEFQVYIPSSHGTFVRVAAQYLDTGRISTA